MKKKNTKYKVELLNQLISRNFLESFIASFHRASQSFSKLKPAYSKDFLKNFHFSLVIDKQLWLCLWELPLFAFSKLSFACFKGYLKKNPSFQLSTFCPLHVHDFIYKLSVKVVYSKFKNWTTCKTKLFFRDWWSFDILI